MPLHLLERAMLLRISIGEDQWYEALQPTKSTTPSDRLPSTAGRVLILATSPGMGP
jgi:hypothetical protein